MVEGNFMNERIESAVQEAIGDAVEKQLTLIKHNLSNVLGGLLYSLKLELEKKGGVCDIDNLVRIVVDSSKHEGPEGEEWAAWDEKNKHAREIIERLVDTLQAHGIEQSWNIGRSRHLKGGAK